MPRFTVRCNVCGTTKEIKRYFPKEKESFYCNTCKKIVAGKKI